MESKQNDKQELIIADLEAVTGGATCVYKSDTYSVGSEVTMANNKTKTCSSDGTWK